MRIAMWSGPRNLSTALMYAFAARGDCAVWDEPFYAAYLASTGLDHPMRAAIIAAGIVDAAEVGRLCAHGDTGGTPHVYQKHMAQHMTPDVPLDWLPALRHAFLIRHPARVVASFAAKRENPGYAELGFGQLAALFDRVRELGQEPPVVDSDELRRDPETTLKRLCSGLNLDFKPKMLTWPAGGHRDDGVWAAHWYGAVHRSTGFTASEPAPLPVLTGDHARLANRAMADFQRLRSVADRQAAEFAGRDAVT